MDTCTLALEYNYTRKFKSKGTVWIFNGDGRGDLDRDEPLGSIAGWTKICGPMAYDEAAQIHQALKEFFIRNGINVIDEAIAD